MYKINDNRLSKKFFIQKGLTLVAKNKSSG